MGLQNTSVQCNAIQSNGMKLNSIGQNSISFGRLGLFVCFHSHSHSHSFEGHLQRSGWRRHKVANHRHGPTAIGRQVNRQRRRANKLPSDWLAGWLELVPPMEPELKLNPKRYALGRLPVH